MSISADCTQLLENCANCTTPYICDECLLGYELDQYGNCVGKLWF